MIKYVFGRPFAKEIRIKIIIGKKTINHCFRADPGRMFGEQEIEKTLENIVDYCEKHYPRLDFRMVKILPNVCNFIAIGERKFIPFVKKEENNEAVETSTDGGNSEGGVSKARPLDHDTLPEHGGDEQFHGGNADAGVSVECDSRGSERSDHPSEGSDAVSEVRSDS